MIEKKKYDSTVARIAGNIAAGLVREYRMADCRPDESPSSFARCVEGISKTSVALARAIVAELERTEPEPKA